MATFTLGDTADDGIEETSGPTVSHTGSAVSIQSWYDGSNKVHALLRFPSVTIAQGATIVSAFLKITPLSTRDNPRLDIYCEDVDDSVDLIDTADITGRTVTSASSAWSADGLGTSEVTSPDLGAAIQEVINRGSWVSGNALSVILLAQSTEPKELAFADEGSSGTTSIVINVAGVADGSDSEYTIISRIPRYVGRQYSRMLPIFSILDDDVPPTPIDAELDVSLIYAYRPPGPPRPTRHVITSLAPYFSPLTSGSPEFDIFAPLVGFSRGYHIEQSAPQRMLAGLMSGSVPIPDAPTSCPATAIITETGIGTAIITGTDTDAETYTAIITETGIGTAIIKEGC